MFWKIITSRFAGPVGAIISAALLGLLIYTAVTTGVTIGGLKRDLSREKELNEVLTTNNATLKGNAVSLEMGLATCGKSVQDAADFAGKLTKAGETALAEVQKAGANVTKKAKAIDAMPAATCDDAMAILKAGGS